MMKKEQDQEPITWLHTPSAMIASIVLGICALFGMGWSINEILIQSSPSTPINQSDQPDQLQSNQPTNTNHDHHEKTIDGSLSGFDVVRRIDINNGSQNDLEQLPGIGPRLAQRIIEYRDTNGEFESIDDLDDVPGIGLKTIERFRSLVLIGD